MLLVLLCWDLRSYNTARFVVWSYWLYWDFINAAGSGSPDWRKLIFPLQTLTSLTMCWPFFHLSLLYSLNSWNFPLWWTNRRFSERSDGGGSLHPTFLNVQGLTPMSAVDMDTLLNTPPVVARHWLIQVAIGLTFLVNLVRNMFESFLAAAGRPGDNILKQPRNLFWMLCFSLIKTFKCC